MQPRNSRPENRSEWIDLETFDVALTEEGTPTGYISTDGAEWVARVTFATDHERFWPSAVSLINAAGQPVSPDMWRRVKVGKVIREATVQFALTGLLMTLVASNEGERQAAERIAALGDEHGDEQARTYTPDHYAEVGAVYMRALALSDTQPVQAVRRAFRGRYPNLRETTVRGWIRTARQRGHITASARPRRAGTTREGG